MSLCKVLFLGVLALNLVRCSMPDDVKAAKDTSGEMNRKLDNMVEKSDVLVDRTSNLFGGARKDLGFERVKVRYDDIVAAPGASTKILYATALATSFEFQQWTGTKSDDAKLKDRMYGKAMRDILVRFESLIDHHYTPEIKWGPFPGVPDNEWKSVASLAVAMGEIDEDQQIASLKAGVREESLYSLIVKGLQYKRKSLFTNDIPEYARQVLKFEEEAVLLLQMRHNYFLAMVMSRFSDFCKANWGGIVKGEGVAKVNEIFTWLDLSALGKPVEIKYVSNIVKVQDEAVLWLQQARETQQVLKKLGYDLQFNSGIQQVFASVNFAKPKNWVGYPVVEATYKDLYEVINDLKKTYVTKAAADGELPSKLIASSAVITDEDLKLLPQVAKPKLNLAPTPPISQ